MPFALAILKQAKHRVRNSIYLWQKRFGDDEDAQCRVARVRDHRLRMKVGAELMLGRKVKCWQRQDEVLVEGFALAEIATGE